jgi:hypothetical protein
MNDIIQLTLDPAGLLSAVRTWQEAVVVSTRGRPPSALRDDVALRSSITGAAERVDGCLMLLQSCAVQHEELQRFNALVGELRSIRDWIQQSCDAVRIVADVSSAIPRGEHRNIAKA